SARGLSLRDRMIAHLPRYAPWAARVPWLANLRDNLPGAATLSEKLVGFAADRPLPRWSKPWVEPKMEGQPGVVFFADTFNRYFEPG
ncbi:MAG: hypothetical protein GTN90_01245, partial [Xanthomonadales bacterium]|nr:hypothetical protein [Xanthomonadales bacterium]